jgi:NADH-quinone oxidoreductase subunit L
VSDAILHGAPEFHVDVFVLALLGFLISLGLAWRIYGRGKPERDPTFELGPVSTLLVNKYYLDDLGYRYIVVPVRDRASSLAYWTNQEVLDRVVKGAGGLTKTLANSTYRTLDQKVIDGGVNGAAFSAAWWSDRLKRVQSGDVQRYAGALVAGVVVLVLVFAAAA